MRDQGRSDATTMHLRFNHQCTKVPELFHQNHADHTLAAPVYQMHAGFSVVARPVEIVQHAWQKNGLFGSAGVYATMQYASDQGGNCVAIRRHHDCDLIPHGRHRTHRSMQD